MKAYQAYLLRLQRGQGQTHWRARLENAQTGEVLYFATEVKLLRYLAQMYAHSSPSLTDDTVTEPAQVDIS